MEPCQENRAIFGSPLLEEPPSPNSGANWSAYQELLQQARSLCEACSCQATCLFDAVVRYDVSGVAGGTTDSERRRIRRRLGVTTHKEDLDRYAGVRARGARINPEDVLRTRRAHPDETIDQLAARIGCDPSSVKRHLRRARNGTPTTGQESETPPTLETVLTAASAVTGRTFPGTTPATPGQHSAA